MRWPVSSATPGLNWLRLRMLDISLVSEETAPPSLLATNISLGVRLDGFKLAAAAEHRWHGLPVPGISSHRSNTSRSISNPFSVWS
jgi:hypothetical protein